MAQARQTLDLPTDKVLLLFGAASLSDPRKGFAQLREALQLVPGVGDRAELILFGADKPDTTDLTLPTRHFGIIKDEANVALLYAACDASLCPTLEDNLPNTVLESLCCGTPVLGFSTGGLPDVVVQGQNGLLADCGDVAGLARHLEAFISHPFRPVGRETQFDLTVQAQTMRHLHESAPPFTATAAPMSTTQEEREWFPLAAAYSNAQAARQADDLQVKLRKIRAKLMQ
jgi:glycosyltransferase involved in cell wall biosynthesis